MLMRRHWPLLAVLAPALALRAAAWFAVQPAWWLLGDSIGYLDDAMHLQPDRWRPSGYSLLLLRPLEPAHQLALVTAVQHLMGLGVGALVYVTLTRLGLPRWAAALAAVPALYDGYVVAGEQMLAAESLFVLLVVGAVALLLWSRDRPDELTVYAAGLLLALATLTRVVGLPLVAVAALALLLPRPSVSRLVALCLPFVVVVGAYALWFSQTYGRVELTASNGVFLYGRTTNFVDCSAVRFSDPKLRQLCPREPVGQRNEVWYVFDVNSPVATMGLSPAAADDLAGRFARQAIAAQPAGFVALAWDGMVKSFGWDQSALPNDMRFDAGQRLPDAAVATGLAYQRTDPRPVYRAPLSGLLARYQGVVSVPATLCLVALLVAVAGLAFGRDPEARGLRRALLLTGGAAAVLLLVPAVTAIAAPRYRVPAIPLLCLTVAISGSLLVNRWRTRRPAYAVGTVATPTTCQPSRFRGTGSASSGRKTAIAARAASDGSAAPVPPASSTIRSPRRMTTSR